MAAATLPSRWMDPAPRSPGGDPLAAVDPRLQERLLHTEPQRCAELLGDVTAYGIYLLDRDGRVTSWNPGAQRITGYRANEILGHPYGALFADAALREGVPGRAIGFVRANHHCREEQLRRRRNGEAFLVIATLDAVRAEDGELLGYIEVFDDITESRRREDQLYERATRDPLTGTFNRGHFSQASAQEIERARRFGEPLSIVKIDIDHYARLISEHGSDAGERALTLLARVVLGLSRKFDILGRLGETEFALTLPRANKEPALEMAEHLREKLAGQRISGLSGSYGFTVSMGLATLRPQTRDLAELMRNADAALYRARRDGRNRVEAWFE